MERGRCKEKGRPVFSLFSVQITIGIVIVTKIIFMIIQG